MERSSHAPVVLEPVPQVALVPALDIFHSYTAPLFHVSAPVVNVPVCESSLPAVMMPPCVAAVAVALALSVTVPVTAPLPPSLPPP